MDMFVHVCHGKKQCLIPYFAFKRKQCTQVVYSYTNESQVLMSKWQMFCNSRRIHRQDLGLHDEGARLLLSSCFSLKGFTKCSSFMEF